jgi:hypothetical protein
MLLSEICGLVSVGRPLWREDGSAICSVITQWYESRRTRNHTLLSYLRLPQPGGPVSRIYIPQEEGGPVIRPGAGFPLCRLLRLAGLRWRYSNPPPTWRARSPYMCGNMEHNYEGASNQVILILSKDFKIKYSGALLMLRGIYEILTYIEI